MSLSFKCVGCSNSLPEGHTLARKFCNDCSHKRRLESHMRRNHKRAGEREFNRIKINLFKNWVMWGIEI
jgi:hypothetical protein